MKIGKLRPEQNSHEITIYILNIAHRSPRMQWLLVFAATTSSSGQGRNRTAESSMHCQQLRAMLEVQRLSGSWAVLKNLCAGTQSQVLGFAALAV